MKVRPAAVAGLFYPADAHELRAAVRHHLAAIAEASEAAKAVIAPHAGYIYSAQVAAHAYAALAAGASSTTRVVIVGPAHRVPFRGVAASSAAAFVTPLGRVPIDTETVARLCEGGAVARLDEAHREEHCLEVHLPFLQQLFDRFSIVPLLVGSVTTAVLSDVLEAVWGGDETVILISSDLSHYHDDRTARRLDRATCERIEALEPVGGDDACGHKPINALLEVARRKGLHVRALSMQNSSDTSGSRERVVGYGAFAVCAPAMHSGST